MSGLQFVCCRIQKQGVSNDSCRRQIQANVRVGMVLELGSFILTLFSFCFSLQLLDMKSTDRKQTLLHYIVRVIQEKYPDLLNFSSELHFLDKAATGVEPVGCRQEGSSESPSR